MSGNIFPFAVSFLFMLQFSFSSFFIDSLMSNGVAPGNSIIQFPADTEANSAQGFVSRYLSALMPVSGPEKPAGFTGQQETDLALGGQTILVLRCFVHPRTYDAGTDTLTRLPGGKLLLEIRQPDFPFTIVYSAPLSLDMFGIGANQIAIPESGNYLICVSGWNVIETCSRSGGEFLQVGSLNSFDFTVSQSMAYAGNLTLVSASPERWGLYSGDVFRDDAVDGTDYILIEFAAMNFKSGHMEEDLNGDELIDATDLSTVDNNAFNFVSSETPY